jgi:hypothetical protein
VLAADTPDTYVRGEEKGRWPGPPFDDLPLVTGTRPTCLVSSRPCRPHQRIVVVHTSKKLGSFPSSQVRAASLHCATWLKEPSWHVVVDGAERSIRRRSRSRSRSRFLMRAGGLDVIVSSSSMGAISPVIAHEVPEHMHLDN